MLYVCTTQHKDVQKVVDVVRHTTKMFNNYSFRRQRIFRRGKVVFFARAEEIIREENAFRIEPRTQYLILIFCILANEIDLRFVEKITIKHKFNKKTTLIVEKHI